MKSDRLVSISLSAAAAVEMDGGGPLSAADIARRIASTRALVEAALDSPHNKYLHEVVSEFGRSFGWVRNGKKLPPGAVDWSRHKIWRPWVRRGDRSPPERLGFPLSARRANRLFPDP